MTKHFEYPRFRGDRLASVWCEKGIYEVIIGHEGNLRLELRPNGLYDAVLVAAYSGPNAYAEALEEIASDLRIERTINMPDPE